MKSLFKNENFWVDKWQEARKVSLYGQEQRRGPEYWDRRAERLATKIKEDRHRKQVIDLMHWLGHHHTMTSDFTVLDIGCGPGTHSLLLARRAEKVVALDPSPKMLQQLHDEARHQGLDNIETVEATWQEINLSERNWQGAFDLVIASKSPGIDSLAALNKMIAACRSSCFFIATLEQSRPSFENIWMELKGKPVPPLPADGLFIQNILYAKGFVPALEMRKIVKDEVMEPEYAVHFFLDLLFPHMELSPRVKSVVENYVTKHLEEGKFIYSTERVDALLFWQVGDQPDQSHHHHHHHP